MHNPAAVGPLAGKVAIVTGSSRSIGAAIAHRLAADGANVIINFHKIAVDAKRTADCINNSPDCSGKAVVVKADVSTVEGGEFLLAECIQNFGPPDILVLNASVMSHTRLANTSEEEFDTTFNTNVKGPLFLAKAVAKVMQPGGRIIFISTALTSASTVLPIALLFTMSKGALEQMTRILAKDLGTRGITVNCVAPGPVDTPVFRAGKTPQQLKSIASLSPQQRLGVPEDISPIVAFLASQDAQWVNGQTIGVNGVRHLSYYRTLP
ncbi:NAD-P-binding protein [Irpex rosettiformis]|uniref:NAD-P-binding protein n=1 Tax=Irpex rosettiformis TaxID=378272 RepID=A0ACB8U0P5_9APHY|nr:NAD-P-binding protein [Irpex rosettiformis]